MRSLFPMRHGETVVRERGTPVLDPYSQEPTARDWSAPAELEIKGVAIAPTSSTEPLADDRQMVVTGMSLYCASGADVLPEDRIRARSGLWQVEGEVADWHHPMTDWSPGAEFRIKKVDG